MSSFNPTPAELALVNQVFAIADPSKLGIITGDAAVKAFAGAKLPPTVLGEIWALADSENNGFLTKKGTALALRLIGHAQKGEKVQEALAQRPGPLAYIEGISPSKPASLPSSPPKSPPPGGSLPPLTAEDKSKFLRLFVGCGPTNGLLNGDKARDVFIKSKLPVDKLSQIWGLADSQDRGALDQADFAIAMYLIQGLMSGKITNIPPTLPLSLYEQAGGRPPVGVVTHGTGNSASLSPSLTGSFPTSTPLTAQTTGGARARLQPQGTGQEYSRLSMIAPPQPQVHFAPNPIVQSLGASAFGTSTIQAWDVTSEEKTRFDQFFDTLDTQKRGYIEGEVAVPFMLQSKLSGEILAHVWDLADLNNDGRLTRDGFAVAMHLIQQKLEGKEIPATLPISLIPPSLRGGGVAPAASAPVQPSVPEPIRDLLWDDDVPTAASPQQPSSPLSQHMSAQSTPLQPQGTGYLQQQQTASLSAARSPTFASPADPFSAGAFSSPGKRDLLSDDEDTHSTRVPDNSAEIGNIQNQINSTNKSLANTQTERQKTENELATQASQLSALQTQLSSAKAAYETETRLLTTLRERYATQNADIQKAREELIRAESDLSGVRVEKTEIEGNLLRDKEEVRGLQRKMKEVGDETEQLKAAVEKAKKESKHQKGLLAIAKKQLASREAEKAKVLAELEEAKRDAQETAKELETTEAELAKDVSATEINGSAITSPAAPSLIEQPRTDTPSLAALQPLPASPLTPPTSMSPPPGGSKTNNPFERLAMSSTGSRPTSPFSQPSTDLFFVPTPHLQSATPQTEAVSPPMSAEPAQEISQEDIPRSFSPPAIAAQPITTATTSNLSANTATTTTDVDDPFGLADDEKLSSRTSLAGGSDKAATPQPVAPAVVAEALVMSPVAVESNQDDFAKPKTTSPSLDAEASRFPAIDGQTGAETISLERTTRFSTDLDSKLVEKEEDESDSDDEGDFHDAAEARLSAGSPDASFAKQVEPSFVETKAASPKPTTTFEDAFGLGGNESTPKAEARVSMSPQPAPAAQSDLFVAFDGGKTNGKAAERSSLFVGSPVAAAPAASGVNAFDEALGRISSSGDSPAVSKFKLDSAFEDNFDFSAAKAELEPSANPFPAPSSSTAAVNGTQENGASSSAFGLPFAPTGQTNNIPITNGAALSFEDAFGSVSSGAPAQTSAQPASQPQAGDHGISFEDAFGGGGNKALAFDNAFGSVSSKKSVSTVPKEDTPKATSILAQSPPAATPPLPQAQAPASPSTTRSVRSTSPPARTSSPKPRRSTGSSNEGVPPSKPAPSTRHSKLSIRLPFGRKDRKKTKPEPPPVPAGFLSPVVEPASGSENVTPSVEDDVEPVKQLCGMGFSRTQAVTALEKHGYDVQRALNSLLGTS